MVHAVTHMLDKEFFSNGAPDIYNVINRRQITEFPSNRQLCLIH